MYGGGLNVAYKSLADTEYAKEQAGLKGSSGEGGVAKTVGYWYNDIGPESLKQCTDAGVKWGNGLGDFTVGGGTDLAKQELGSYFTVTWTFRNRSLTAKLWQKRARSPSSCGMQH